MNKEIYSLNGHLKNLFMVLVVLQVKPSLFFHDFLFEMLPVQGQGKQMNVLIGARFLIPLQLTIALVVCHLYN